MLFNSYEFIFLFLPLTLLLFFLIGGRGHHRAAISWLVAASLFFYGWWNPAYLGLIVGSILFNYALGSQLSLAGYSNRQHRWLLIIGISANLALLGYFKYANFFLENISIVAGVDLTTAPILLPLAISFFTFQQISFLIDAYQHKTREYNFLHYCLFVTFFPQLIAGPIVHHREMLPQFAQKEIYSPHAKFLAVGLTIFFIGLFKKVIIADNLAPYTTQVFNAARDGELLTFFEAWRGTFAYSFQLYFDFSGYSDMAVGLAYMFGIVLPINFHSPYKATNIVDFWRRWHMTLSRFLRDYLYIPLGGNRKGTTRRYLNLMLTMLIGGLWHGAAWTFIIWGGLHGIYLCINHLWHRIRKAMGSDLQQTSLVGTLTAQMLTFLAVSIAWVYFRAADVTTANAMIGAMAGLNGIIWPGDVPEGLFGDLLSHAGWQFAHLNYFKGGNDLILIVVLLLFVWYAPNTLQMIGKYRPAHEQDIELKARFFQWQPSVKWLLFILFIALWTILSLSQMSEFLYFQF